MWRSYSIRTLQLRARRILGVSQWRVGHQPLGGAASLISPLFSLSPIQIYTFLLYISHSILTGVAFLCLGGEMLYAHY